MEQLAPTPNVDSWETTCQMFVVPALLVVQRAGAEVLETVQALVWFLIMYAGPQGDILQHDSGINVVAVCL